VAPTDHRAWLGDCGDGELDALASALQAVTRAYDALFGRPFPYVMVVHQPGHLHVELYPPLRSADRLKHLAGSELGAGTFAVDVLPERAADALREAIARDG
jgi:UDPglucose--hexose-1-phosphate uridylyltransferase